MALNKVMLIGNVGNDPEVRYLESNSPNPGNNAKVASFRLATTERYRDRNGETRENTEWHNIVAWRNSADIIEKYVKKGTQVYIEGKLRTRQWTDQSGNKRYTTEIQVDNIQLLGRRPDVQQGGYAGQGSGYGGQNVGYGGQNAGYGGQNTGYGGQNFGYQAPAQPASQPAAPAASNAQDDDLPF